MALIKKLWWSSIAIFVMGLTACLGVTPLADEAPYNSMVGQCYEIQKDMRVRENSCGELGDLILSPSESKFCFKATVASIRKGSRFHIADIRRQSAGSIGYCPQIEIIIDGTNVSDRKINLPLCFSRDYISWLESPLWRRGEELRLKGEYAKPCATP